jgi:hypothetical protein
VCCHQHLQRISQCVPTRHSSEQCPSVSVKGIYQETGRRADTEVILPAAVLKVRNEFIADLDPALSLISDPDPHLDLPLGLAAFKNTQLDLNLYSKKSLSDPQH